MVVFRCIWFKLEEHRTWPDDVDEDGARGDVNRVRSFREEDLEGVRIGPEGVSWGLRELQSAQGLPHQTVTIGRGEGRLVGQAGFASCWRCCSGGRENCEGDDHGPESSAYPTPALHPLLEAQAAAVRTVW